jgi:glycosyltransferase involved in cell wall biosynthesis
MCKGMVSKGSDVTVYTTDAGLPRDDEGVQRGFRVIDGVKVYYFKCDSNRPIISRALTTEIRKKIGEFDVMDLDAVWHPLSIGARRAAVKHGCPYVISLHGALDPWSRAQKRLKKFLYYLFVERKNIKAAAGIRYTSKMEQEWSCSFTRPGKEQRVIPNGIDFQFWIRNAEAAKRWRAQAGIPSNCFLFLSVGRLHKAKGLDLVVNALKSLHGQEWHMAFVGNDEDGTRAKLARQVKELGLINHVSFHSTVPPSSLPAIYSAGDLFVLPSHHENFGNVVLEALVCGCPVLISDQVGIAGELHGIKGVEVRTRDLLLWSEALTRALSKKNDYRTNPSDREELVRKFSVGNCAARMIELHRSVVAASRYNNGYR